MIRLPPCWRASEKGLTGEPAEPRSPENTAPPPEPAANTRKVLFDHSTNAFPDEDVAMSILNLAKVVGCVRA